MLALWFEKLEELSDKKKNRGSINKKTTQSITREIKTGDGR
jgi:hypothetical protein